MAPSSKDDSFYGRIGSQPKQYKFDPDVISEGTDYEFITSEAREVYSAIADTIYAFAERIDASIDKYYKDLPLWFIEFYHPIDWLGRIDVACRERNIASLHKIDIDKLMSSPVPVVHVAGWWKTPSQTKFNRLRTIEVHDPARNTEALSMALDAHYKATIAMSD